MTKFDRDACQLVTYLTLVLTHDGKHLIQGYYSRLQMKVKHKKISIISTFCKSILYVGQVRSGQYRHSIGITI